MKILSLILLSTLTTLTTYKVPVFNNISKGLIDKPMCDIMSNGKFVKVGFAKKNWLNNSVKESENIMFNYYFVPKDKQRYNPKSKYYQSWFGCYVIYPSKPYNKEFIKYFLDSINMPDMKGWLYNISHIGNPTVYIKGNVIINKINDNVYKTGLSVISNVDIGCQDTLLNKNLTNKPKINKKLICLKYTIYFTFHKDFISVAYFNGVEFADKRNKIHNTYDLVKDEYTEMCLNIDWKQMNFDEIKNDR